MLKALLTIFTQHAYVPQQMIQHNQQDQESEEQPVHITENEVKSNQSPTTQIKQPTTNQQTRSHHHNGNDAQANEIDAPKNLTTNKDPVSLPQHTGTKYLTPPTSTREPTSPEHSPLPTIEAVTNDANSQINTQTKVVKTSNFPKLAKKIRTNAMRYWMRANPAPKTYQDFFLFELRKKTALARQIVKKSN